VRARTELAVKASDAGREALADGTRLGDVQRRILEALNGTELSARELDADRAALKRLERRGFVRLREVDSLRSPEVARIGAEGSAIRLSPAQRAAVARVERALDGEGEAELLLHGITGSGKTEVYLAAAAATLARDRTAIVLVPEIGLTPQTASRFRSRFGDRVAILHSALGDGERYDEWRRLRAGKARICVGPRSAVFAPLDDLGLIVVDEEHDSSYKQERDPRYDARDVARRRALDAGAVLLAGSATPRPESWLAMERLELPERADGAALPEVEVVDMRGSHGALHPRTLDALAELRDAGGKGIVLLNRRGFAPHLGCSDCGKAWQCPNCDVSLVLHRRHANLVCHHCGHAEATPRECPDCGSVSIAQSGVGTERLEAMLSDALSPLPIFRLDSDSAAGSGGHLRILREFQEAERGALVGTQMVAKGHDFHDVILGVVLDADATLRFPDFRSEERTFTLIAQLAGRSGRGAASGRVLVQTLAPGAAAIRTAARHDAPRFLDEELSRRKSLRYPPFAHLIEVQLSSPDEEAAERAAGATHDALADSLPGEVELLGPAPLFRLRGRYRRRLVIKAGDRAATVDAVREAVEELAASRSLRDAAISVDVDPQ
jgi:primosomal protein N' (replication factor Y)